MISSLAIVMILFRDVFLLIEKIIYMLQSISNISITKLIIKLTYYIENGYAYNIMLILLIPLASIFIGLISTRIGDQRLKYNY